jgi:FkbM family methyltransferase
MLCANCALNGLNNVYAFQKGAGSKKNILLEGPLLSDQPSNQGNFPLGTIPGTSEVIEVITIDDMLDFLKPISLLKVDAEGSELDVLIGARGLIKRDKPFLYLENDRPEKSSELIEFVMEMNYDLWWHIVHLFRKHNRAHTVVNIFGNIASFNMLCLPKDSKLKVSGLQKIDNPKLHPLSK